MVSSYRRLSGWDIFGIRSNDIFKHLPHKNNLFITGSGRGGLEVCIDLLGLNEKDSVLMPVLTAEGAVQPFYKKNIKVIFFDLKPTLEIDVDKIENAINTDPSIRCLLIIHYLGYPQHLREIKHVCERKGLYLIEDCAQALFSSSSESMPLGSYGDISLFSLGKTIPVIDGAVFCINSSRIVSKPIKYRHSLQGLVAKLSILFTLILNNYISGMKISRLFWKLNTFNKRVYEFYYKMLRRAPKPMKMSYISRRITKNLKYEEIIRNIKSNLSLIYEKIDTKKYKLLFKDYNLNYVLMGVPIISNDRDSFRSLLRSKGIFCTIYDRHWNYIPQCEEELYPNAIGVLNNVLILPLSYKSTKSEVMRMIETVNEITI